MSTLPAGLTQKDLDRYAQLDAGMRKIADEHKALNDKIKRAHTDAGITGKKTLTYESTKFGTVIVTLGEQKRVDTDALELAHSSEKFPQYWALQFNQTAVDKTVVDKYRTKIISTLSIKVAE